MGVIYEEYKDEDGFLYIVYSGENIFGMWFCVNLFLRCFLFYFYLFCLGDCLDY